MEDGAERPNRKGICAGYAMSMLWNRHRELIVRDRKGIPIACIIGWEARDMATWNVWSRRIPR